MELEWEEEVDTWTSEDHNEAFGSVLKLPLAGTRSLSNGSLAGVGAYGYYWSSTVCGSYARSLLFSSSNASMNAGYRAGGFSVRCIKD